MFKNLIAGEWVDGAAVSRNINPSDTRDLISEYAQADAAQADLAVSAAAASAADPDGSGHAPGDPVAPEREKP